jgi:hypothetical protein
MGRAMNHDNSQRPEALRAIAGGLRLVADGIERLALAQAAPVADVYTSKQLPPGMSRSRFVRRCRELARSGVDGVTRCGRTWTALRSLFDERLPLPVGRHFTGQQPVEAPGRPWTPETALREAGARRGEP